MSTLAWVILPYVTIAVLVVGSVWRYRYDKFGWTTRSSQLYESRLLRIASPLFHFGILVVIVGHLIGLVIPESWTSAAGLSEHGYHVRALILGGVAGLCSLAGVVLLVYRRRTTGPVFMATTKNDKTMYVVLVAAIVAGLATTLLGSGVVGEEHNYPRDRLAVVPFGVRAAAGRRGHARSPARVPAAHLDRHAAVRDLALHPPGARLQRTGRLPVPAVRAPACGSSPSASMPNDPRAARRPVATSSRSAWTGTPVSRSTVNSPPS